MGCASSSMAMGMIRHHRHGRRRRQRRRRGGSPLHRSLSLSLSELEREDEDEEEEELEEKWLRLQQNGRSLSFGSYGGIKVVGGLLGKRHYAPNAVDEKGDADDVYRLDAKKMIAEMKKEEEKEEEEEREMEVIWIWELMEGLEDRPTRSPSPLRAPSSPIPMDLRGTFNLLLEGLAKERKEREGLAMEKEGKYSLAMEIEEEGLAMEKEGSAGGLAMDKEDRDEGVAMQKEEEEEEKGMAMEKEEEEGLAMEKNEQPGEVLAMEKNELPEEGVAMGKEEEEEECLAMEKNEQPEEGVAMGKEEEEEEEGEDLAMEREEKAESPSMGDREEGLVMEEEEEEEDEGLVMEREEEKGMAMEREEKEENVAMEKEEEEEGEEGLALACSNTSSHIATELKSLPGGEGKAVLYFTSLRCVRKTYEDSCALRLILRGAGVCVDERDTWMHRGFRTELTETLGYPAPVPRLFIGGRHVGGADEVRHMHETGALLELLRELPEQGDKDPCHGCGDWRFVPCLACNGSCKQIGDEGETLRCFNCNENGLMMCPGCSPLEH